MFLIYKEAEKGRHLLGLWGFEADVKRKRLRLKPQKSVREPGHEKSGTCCLDARSPYSLPSSRTCRFNSALEQLMPCMFFWCSASSLSAVLLNSGTSFKIG